MDITKAELASKLLAELRDVERVHESTKQGPQKFWQLMVDTDRLPIPARVKRFFADAIDKALEYYKSEIEKI